MRPLRAKDVRTGTVVGNLVRIRAGGRPGAKPPFRAEFCGPDAVDAGHEARVMDRIPETGLDDMNDKQTVKLQGTDGEWLSRADFIGIYRYTILLEASEG